METFKIKLPMGNLILNLQLFFKREIKRRKDTCILIYRILASLFTEYLAFLFAEILALLFTVYRSIKKLLKNIKPVNKEHLNIKDNTIYFEGEMEGKISLLKVIAASEDKMGMPALSSLATRMITNFKPKYLVSCQLDIV